MEPTRTTVAIVGAGPIGIELAVALKQAGIDHIQLEAGPIGDTLTWWAPQTPFFSSPERIAIAGVPLQTDDQTKATREEYLTYLRTVVQLFDLDIRLYERVTAIKRTSDDGPFELTTRARTDERTVIADKVVLAVGDMQVPRRLGIPGEDLPHVSHYLGEPHQYFRQRVLIVGGKNSAVEAAIRLHRIGADVTISYRGREFSKRVKYWLRPELLALIREDRIGFLPGTVPVEITAGRVVLDDVDEETGTPLGKPFEHEADMVLLLTGYEQDVPLFQQAGITLVGDARKPEHDERTMETNVPGVYVAGTAAAGTQRGVTVFIETAHVHVDRIVAHLTGGTVAEGDLSAPEYTLPES